MAEQPELGGVAQFKKAITDPTKDTLGLTVDSGDQGAEPSDTDLEGHKTAPSLDHPKGCVKISHLEPQLQAIIGILSWVRRTQASLIASNLIYGVGQIIFETDMINMKVGDGVTAYTSLPYIGTPPGAFQEYGGTTAPTGWLLCDGTSYLRTAYPTLFAKIGIAYGTADGTHFNVPDMRGQFPRGVDGAAGVDPDKASRVASAAGGNTGNNVGSKQLTATKLPGTAFTTNTVNLDHTHSITICFGGGTSNPTLGLGNAVPTSSTSTGAMSANATHSHTVNGGGDNESRPPNVYCNYIVKV